MITQKPISLKIDTELLKELDAEAALTWRKRNWHINQAIRLYLSLKDCQRLSRSVGDAGTKADVIEEWLKFNFPEAAHW